MIAALLSQGDVVALYQGRSEFGPRALGHRSILGMERAAATRASGSRRGIHAATIGVYARNGTVFTAGTTDCAQVLDQDRSVATITRNVVERLLRRSNE